MIRNGYARRLQADAERASLVERWQSYPSPVQSLLAVLLRSHGLQAAQLATQAVEEFAQQRPVLHEKESNDATPSA